MRLTTRFRSPASRDLAPHWTALSLVLVLMLGGVFHLGHHLFDPGCGDGRGPDSRPCAVCATFLTAAVPGHAVSAAPAAPCAPSDIVPPATHAPAVAASPCGAPRAPPRG